MPHSLRTERLVLRRSVLRDADDLTVVFGDRDVAVSTKTWGHPLTREETLFRLRQWRTSDPRETFGLVMVQNGRVIGSIGLSQRLGRRWSIGYSVRKDLWGQGLTTEAVRALCAHAFRALPVNAIEADIFTDNVASQRVALKVGFRPLGDIGPGWSMTRRDNFPRLGFRLTRQDLKP
ncbi:Ribosomal-protein-alanine acetyltransferase [Parvularcula bermudensis HTCC2503]|uniref:Ribosomal-protein-alanine acetyltransferase n=1 Tax=Parvularcula bermudensis (strain ATCC BAA-594 / HTCC2503 / KCTC 12087) TaxID=314260 RepID=E0TG96_PARBH|nr:GNAT family N-acetyltransferase [Parvularcula bermudensis]ADM09139.1 Ribosomal-protein-alanine acetyltransferase [Parvularcula bermudensis HTCC2503]